MPHRKGFCAFPSAKVTLVIPHALEINLVVKQLSPDPTPHRLQVFVACLLAFAIFITPISAIAGPSIVRATVANKADKTDKGDKTNKPKSAAEELFVNPPVAPAT